jgi:flavin reductase (DIM6/NTAB) family NADH-FMN oxidoreductase RutF
MAMDYQFHSYEPKNGHGLPHDPFNAIVGPRPIGWIASQSSKGILNLAPYSFFNAFNYIPPIVGFSSTGFKDSVTNISETGEFTWNLVTYDLAEQMNASCAAVPPEVNEFELAHLTPFPSSVIQVPRVKESKVSFECKVAQIIQLQTSQGEKLDTWLTLGEVVAIHIADHLLHDGIYNTAQADHILRGGGPADYFRITPQQLFQMHRPK